MVKIYASLIIKGIKTIGDVPTRIKDEVKQELVVVYATLIIKGVKTIDDVPARIKDKVVQVLIDLDCGDSAGQA